MNIAIVMCLYSRFENLRRWIHAWNMCDKMGAKLFIVNNQYNGIDINFWSDYCKIRDVNYILRPNIGFETGVIQDVILGNILEEENWDILLFITDDTIPMKKDFLKEYIEELKKPGVGLSCMQISGVYTPHVRTTGFCITREIANRIQFPYVPIENKEHCYHFEHTGGDLTLMSQVLRMNKRVVQVSEIEKSGLWDTDYTEFNRWEEWHTNFPNYNG